MLKVGMRWGVFAPPLPLLLIGGIDRSKLLIYKEVGFWTTVSF